jgi:glutathione S-transferase
VGEAAGPAVSAGDAAGRIKRQVEDGAEKAQREFEAAKADLEAKRRAAEGPPAEDADEAAQQVRDIRTRLDQDLDALEARIPPRDTLVAQAKTIGGAAVAGVAVVAALTTWLSKRGEEKELEEEAERAARAIARHLPDAWAEVERRRELAAIEEHLDEDGGFGTGRKLTIVALLVAAAVAIWSQLQGRDEPDVWGPPPA